MLMGCGLQLCSISVTELPVIIVWSLQYRMTEYTEDTDVEEIKKENDKIIMKIFSLQYEKFFPQEDQDEK